MKTKFRYDFNLLPVMGLSLLLLGDILGNSNAFAGSLWRESVTDERGMFADKRARRVGDLLTVVCKDDRVIFRNTQSLVDNRINASQPGMASRFLNQLIGGVTSEAANRAVSGGTYQGTRSFPGNLVPRGQTGSPYLGSPGSFNIDNTNTVDQGQTFNLQEASIGVQVIDVLPNGNLVVEGIREISIQENRGRIYLRGLVRALDLNAINAVSSALVADLRLEFSPEGANAQTFRKGWLQKVDEKITPW
jgi:flagellar L-ring protein precursor FlgH